MKNKNNNNVKMWQLFHPEWFQAITGSTRACLEIKGYSTCSPAPPLQSRFPGSYPLEGHFHPILRFLPQRQGPPYPGGVGGEPIPRRVQPPPASTQDPSPSPGPPRGRGGEGAWIQRSSTMQVAFLLFQANKSRSGAVGPEKGAFPLMNVISIPVNIHKITPALICIK